MFSFPSVRNRSSVQRRSRRSSRSVSAGFRKKISIPAIRMSSTANTADELQDILYSRCCNRD